MICFASLAIGAAPDLRASALLAASPANRCGSDKACLAKPYGLALRFFRNARLSGWGWRSNALIRIEFRQNMSGSRHGPPAVTGLEVRADR